MFASGMRKWLGKKPFFHGTPDVNFDLDNIDPSKFRSSNYGPGLYVSARPTTASGYAGTHGAVFPVQIADDARVLDLTTPEGRKVYSETKDHDILRQHFDVIRAPGESVILNPKVARSVFDR